MFGYVSKMPTEWFEESDCFWRYRTFLAWAGRRLEPEEDCEENPNERSVRQPIAGQNEFVKPGVQVTWSFAGRTLGLSAIVIRRSVNNSTATSSTSHKQAQGLCRALGSRFTIEVSQENGGIR